MIKLTSTSSGVRWRQIHAPKKFILCVSAKNRPMTKFASDCLPFPKVHPFNTIAHTISHIKIRKQNIFASRIIIKYDVLKRSGGTAGKVFDACK